MKHYMQTDGRWAFKKIPATDMTIESHGCLVCCIAMLGGKKPDDMISELTFSNGMVNHSSVPGWSELRCPRTPAPIRSFKYPCIAEIRLGRGTHFMVLEGLENGMLKMLDPLSCYRYFENKYGNPERKIIRMISIDHKDEDRLESLVGEMKGVISRYE